MKKSRRTMCAVWEMRIGDIGRLRDKNKTLIYCSQQRSDGGRWIQTIERNMNICLVGTDSTAEIREDFTRMELTDTTVDLLPFKLK